MGHRRSTKRFKPQPAWELTRKVGLLAVIFLSVIWFIYQPGFEPLIGIVGGTLTVLAHFGFRNSKYRQIADLIIAISTGIILILISLALITRSSIFSQSAADSTQTPSIDQTLLAAGRDGFLVLIADFDGPEPEKYRVTETLADGLSKEVNSFPNIKVKRLNKTITQAEGSEVAWSEGGKYNAALVIWGWYGVTSTSVPMGIHLEFLGTHTEGTTSCSGSTSVVRTIPRTAIEDVTLQTDLLNELTITTTTILGWIHFSAGNYKEATNYFNSALEHLPASISIIGNSNSEDALFDKNVIYLALANAHFLQGKDFFQPLYYNKVISLDPKNPIGYYFRGHAYFQLGDFKNAIVDYNKVIELSPQNAAAYFDLGRAHEANQQIDAAREAYQTALSIDSDTVLQHFSHWAIAQEGYNDSKEVIVDFTEKILSNPDMLIYYYIRGLAYKQSNNYNAAIEDYTTIIESDNQDATVYRLRGEAYFLQDKLDLAILDFDKAIDLNGNVPCYFVDRGDAYAQKGMVEQAKADYGQAIAIAPDFHVPYFMRATIKLQKGDWEASFDDIQSAIKYNPNSIDPYKLRIDYLVGADEEKRREIAGDKENVEILIGDLDRLIVLDPEKASAYYFLRGYLYQSLGNNSAARADYHKVSELDPNVAAQVGITKLIALTYFSSSGWLLLVLTYIALFVSVALDAMSYIKGRRA